MNSLAWISFKLLFSKKTIFNGSTLLSFIGLVIGVASLVVSMAIMSGFEQTLKMAMADVTGHVQVLKRANTDLPSVSIEEKLFQVTPDVKALTKFSYLEAVAAKQGILSGVVLQGLESHRFNSVLNLKKRIIKGEDRIELIEEGLAWGMIGKGLAQKFGITVGDTLSVVIPIADEYGSQNFHRKLGKIKVSAILDLGKYEYNERFIVTDLKVTQDWGQIGDEFQGFFLKYPNVDDALQRSVLLSYELGRAFSVQYWGDVNGNLFEATQIERVVIFFVVLIIVIVAAFNISSNLFMNVVRRYPEIAILKTLGMSQKKIQRLFALQGLMVGAVGLIVGILLGIVMCGIVSWLQTTFQLIPGSVYKLDYIDFSIRWTDLAAISSSTLIICFIATLAPSRKGAQLQPMEGLRNV